MSSVPMLSLAPTEVESDWIEIVAPESVTKPTMRYGNARIALAISRIRGDIRSSSPATIGFDTAVDARPVDDLDTDTAAYAAQRWDD